MVDAVNTFRKYKRMIILEASNKRHSTMTIYTVLKDEAVEFEQNIEALISFTTKEAAINYLQGLVSDVKAFWKGLGKFDEMIIDNSTPYYFSIWKDFDYPYNHTTLSISENKLVGVC